jgi:hypothetical protein
MASMSNYLENKLIDFLLRGQSFTAPTTVYFALCTSTPTDASTGSTISEVSGGNYSRQSLTCNATNFLSTQGNTSTPSSGTNGTTSNNSTIAWSSVTWTATITAVAICDASSGGNLLWYAALGSSKTINSSDSVSFAVGDLTLQIDG